MGRWEIVRLMRWMPTLSHVPHDDRDWLADKIDGHPRTVEYLEILAHAAVRRRSDGGASLDEQSFQGSWRDDVLQPILDEVGGLLEADLLLRHVWQALDAEAQEHLGRCTVLTAPAPREVIRLLAAGEDRSDLLVSSGLLSPFRVGAATWWAPHRLVSETVAGLWGGETTEAHRIVGEWFQKNFEEHSTGTSAERAVEHFCRAGDGDTVFPTAQKLILHLRGAGRYREALGWVERLLDGGVSGSQRGLSLSLKVQMMRFAGIRAATMIELLQEALPLVSERDQGNVLFEMGSHFAGIGRLQEAADHFEQAIESDTRIYGEESSDIAASLHSLAGVLKAQGDLAGARQRLERSLEIKARVFGTEDHPDVAASLHSLAGVLKAQGDLAGARQRLERSLEISARVFGTEDHPDVAASLHELAGVLKAQGDLAGARQRLERSLEISARVFGTEDHPDVAASLHSLAGVLKAQGDLAGARQRLERSLEIKARVFGTEDHPDVAASLHELAGVLKAQGDLAGARQRLERSLEISARVFGTEDHPDVAASLHSLAGVLKAQGDLAGARQRLERSLEIQARVFGTEDHPDVAASLHSLAGVLQAQGDLAGARQRLERVLEIEEKVYGTRDHYSTAMTEQALGMLLLQLGDVEEGLGLLVHAFQVYRQQLGDEHPYTRQLAGFFQQFQGGGEDNT